VRKDAILLNMTDSIRQLTAPSEAPEETHREPPGAPDTATPQPRDNQAPLEGPQPPSERPWWRRMFGT
jgi:hypothetical protein